ncbi:DUF2726 domain-containing protein [Empedobacter sp. ULE_I140]
MRETVLSYLQQKEFNKIIDILKDNRIFNNLISDEIFNIIFFQNFTTELFNQEELEVTYPAFLYQCHSSNDYIFEFNKEDEEKILIFLINKTRNYNYAKKLPQYSESILIIQDHNNKMQAESEKSAMLAKKHRDLEIVEKYSKNRESLIKSIFNSPQEKDFYKACQKVFENHLILPNVSLSTLFNQNIVQEKYKSYFNYFLKSSIDCVVVDGETYIPILFFELDSKTYHLDDEAKLRDEIKNKLVTEFGSSLIRITRKTGKESVKEFINFLEVIKEEKRIV